MTLIPASHPALPGHFPGHPVVPGVVLMDRILDEAAAQQPGVRVVGIHKLKFLRPLLPEQGFSVHTTLKNQRLRFRCLSGDELLVEGSLLLAEADA